MKDFETKYFPHLKDKLEFLDKQDYYKRKAFIFEGTPSQINSFLSKMEDDKNLKTLVFMDELSIKVENGKQDCHGIVGSGSNNCEFFIAVREAIQ